MELMNDNLQSLIERAKALHDEISFKIEQHDSVRLCRFCSEHGQHYCGVTVTETPLEERESLIATRDSLKNVENMLVFFQRLNSWQQKDRYAALARMEESRQILTEKVTHFQGRALDVIEELKTLKTCFEEDDTKTASNSKTTVVDKIKQNILCFGSLIKPWNWHNTAKEAMKLILVSAFISSAFGFCRIRQGCDGSRRKMLSFADSTTAGGRKDFRLTASKNSFDVFHGRG
ncbi:uncharacterized protein LOC114260806 [Camellia sinensis]|nr:uncharacterized protein LOC114260806 [Camellia sinensis]